jgi:hypothetical protein
MPLCAEWIRRVSLFRLFSVKDEHDVEVKCRVIKIKLNVIKSHFGSVKSNEIIMKETQTSSYSASSAAAALLLLLFISNSVERLKMTRS